MSSSDQLQIDGYFEDWLQIQKYQDSDWNEYQEGPEEVVNQNVDLSEYASVMQGSETFFYMSVNGEILSGITIPYDEPKQKNSVQFSAGASLASIMFFFSLAFGARVFSPLMTSRKSWQTLDVLIALVMFALAYSMGYVPKVTSVASTMIDYYQQVPAILSASVYVPDYNYSLLVPENNSITANNQTSTKFLTKDVIDFSASSSLDPTTVSVYQISAGNPSYYLLKKTRKATSAEIITLGNKFLDDFEELVKNLNSLATALQQPIGGPGDISPPLISITSPAVELATSEAKMLSNIKNYKSLVPKIKNSGSICLGKYAVMAMTDYNVGSNHVLPTNGSAKYSSGISVNEFYKRIYTI